MANSDFPELLNEVNLQSSCVVVFLIMTVELTRTKENNPMTAFCDSKQISWIHKTRIDVYYPCLSNETERCLMHVRYANLNLI